MLQMKNINPLAPPAPPATSSFTQPVVTKINICEIIYYRTILKASINCPNPRGSCRDVLASVKQEKEIPVKKQLWLALIKQAGGLYGRILTEVVSTDQTQWGLYTQPRSRFSHTDRLSPVNKMFINMANKKNLIHLMSLVCTNWHFACERGWAEFNSQPKFARPLYFFFSSGFLALPYINIVRWK